MISLKVLRNWTAIYAFLLLGSVGLQAEPDGEEFRTWTSPNGAKIEAYLKKVLPEAIVIVRRDGQEFTAPLDRFSEEDQTYVTEWMQRKLPSAANFRALDFSEVDLPQSHTVENVTHVRPGAGEPPEVAAIKMVLDFHQVTYDENLTQRIRIREAARETVIPPQDLVIAMQNLPVEAEIFRRGGERVRRDDPSIKLALNAIRKAISLDLPVIIGHRPLIEEETPEFVVVATGYDRRNLNVLDPAGSRRATRLDLRTLEETLIYAMVLFPKFEPAKLIPVAKAKPPNELLSRISAAIQEVTAYEAPALTELLNEKGIDASLQDVNRTDFRDQLGRTRSFARQGGIPQVNAALDGGKVVVVPQEFETGTGFALIYGREGDNFTAVEFFPDRAFNRRPLTAVDLANRWLSRENRSYRLDLIQITIRPTSQAPSTPGTPPPAPRDPPPRRPPPPPR